jgi:hypothetical protein
MHEPKIQYQLQAEHPSVPIYWSRYTYRPPQRDNGILRQPHSPMPLQLPIEILSPPISSHYKVLEIQYVRLRFVALGHLLTIPKPVMSPVSLSASALHRLEKSLWVQFFGGDENLSDFDQLSARQRKFLTLGRLCGDDGAAFVIIEPPRPSCSSISPLM